MIDVRIPTPVLVGRAPQIARLSQLLDLALGGAGQFVAIAGDVGTGKSRLCRELRALAVARGARWIEGRATAAERDQSYGLVVSACRALVHDLDEHTRLDLLRPFASELIKLLPDIGWLLPESRPSPPLEPAAERGRLREAVYQLLAALARRGPVVLLLEDIQWADALSLDVLTYLARGAPQQPLLIVCTYRNSEIMPAWMLRAIGVWEQERLVSRLEIHPLEADALDALVRAVLPAEQPVSPAFLTALHLRTGGNPFFAEELLRLLAGTARLQDTLDHGPGTTWEHTFLPQTLTRTLLDQIEQLSASAQALLRIAAGIGQTADFDLLRAVVGVDTATLLGWLRELVGQQMLRPRAGDSQSYAVRNTLLREAVLGMLLPPERRDLHGRIAEALEAQQADLAARVDAAVVASHWLRSAAPERALPALRRAAEEAAGCHAFATAEQHSRAAAGIAPAGTPPRATLFALAGDMAARIGETRRTIDYYRAALDGGVTGLHRKLAVALLDAGDYAEAAEQIGLAQAAPTHTADPIERASTLLVAARVNQAIQQIVSDNDYQQVLEARALFQATEQHGGLAEAEETLVGLEATRGDWVAQRAHAEGALAAAEAAARPDIAARSSLWLAVWWLPLDPARTTMLFERARAIIAASGCLDEAVTLAQCEAHFHWLHGRYRMALAACGEAEALVRRLGLRAALSWNYIQVGHCYRRLGAWEQSEVAYLHGLEHAPHAYEAQAGIDMRAQHGLGRLRLDQGRFAEAEGHLLRATGEVAGEHRRAPLWSWPALTELYARTGDIAKAEHYAARTHDLYTALPSGDRHAHSAAALDAFTTGLVLSASGKWEAAASAFATSRIRWQRLGWPHEIGRVLVEQAVVRIRRRNAGDRSLAMAALREAQTIFSAIGARPELERITQLAARERLLLDPSPATPALATSLPLTARELDIVAQLARGRTNRQIAAALVLSEKTVETHVSHILAKLQLTSRAQVAMWSRDQGVIAPPAAEDQGSP